jgi:hypothetical protein
MERKYRLVPGELPKRSRASQLTELLSEFQRGTVPLARVDGIKDRGEAMRVRTQLNICAKRCGLDRDVKVMIRGADVYLARRVKG